MFARLGIIFIAGLFCVCNVHGADAQAEQSDAQKQMRVSELSAEVEALEKQLQDCEKLDKKWRTATYVGAGAAAATAVGAVVQGVELAKYKSKNPDAKSETQNGQNSDKKSDDKDKK